MPHTLPRPSINPSRAGRRRRFVGWTLLTLGLLVAWVWVASGWVGVSFTQQTWQVDFGSGTLRVMTGPFVRPRTGWAIGSHSPWWEWTILPRSTPPTSTRVNLNIVGFAADYPLAQHTTLMVLYWPIPFLLGLAGALVLRSGIAARRAIAGRCRKCGYNLAGLETDAPCPECGKKKGN